MRRHAILLGAFLAFALTQGCSGDEKEIKEGTPQALQVCKFAGESSCGLDESGKEDALLLCEVTTEHGRVWTLVSLCPAGCEAAACLPLPEDARTGDGLGGDDADTLEEDLPPPCIPACQDKECGDDGCGGNCGLCPPDHQCGEDFTCFLHCEPKCTGKQCGDDGCGGSCGDCPFNMACNAGSCVCNPQCEGKDCGPDGCGGSCGECALGFQCSPFGLCEEICKPQCEGKLCGPDGCGGTCGACPPGLYCSPDGSCTDVCYPDCANKQCGPDGCGNLCGFCPCQTCAPDQVECSPKGICQVSQAGFGCYDLILCLNECVAGDSACQMACFNGSTPQAQNMYEDLIDCIVVQCGSSPSDACVQEVLSCSGQYLACIND